MKTKPAIIFSGWIVFAISLFIYVLTLEPTTSFWDCSEFILSASKLEVNHPSGAPLFMLLGRVFSLFSFGNSEKIAWAINFMSAFFSAFTVYFLFHVILFLSKKITKNPFQYIGSALIGALTFSFTDSFWFSAVEGEVYALSMFFLIISFWAILKWETNFGKRGNERWILFIALMTGLGLGVHLLNLLIIPSVVMVVGFKTFKNSLKVAIVSFTVGCLVLLGVMYVITPAVLFLLSNADLLFVNNFGLPVNSGAIVGIFILLLVFVLSIRFFLNKKKNNVVLALLSVGLLLIGFSVYSVNLIRSQADTPVNFGQPDNIYSLIDYLNREQYPKRPLVYGENYNSSVTGIKNRYTKILTGKKYTTAELPGQYVYAPETCTFFPRLYSNNPGHTDAYKTWIDIKGKKVRAKNGAGKFEIVTVPTLSDNIRFFLRFQVGHMYLRYLMWNFTGRQNDIQGRGEITQGNWLSGIKPIDSLRLGPQDNLPLWLKNNKARNTYFFIPFLLGLIGLVFQYRSNRASFFVVLSLFLLAGVGLVVYINEIPIVPRERDYVFVGSFLAFSIWVGISFIGISEWAKKLSNKNYLSVIIFVVILLFCPVLILSQNFDDHNRSNRYAARDFAANILKSCPPNAILFSSGDNDTYPLLYCQEVENIRTDVRIVIMPFLSANWFVGQLKLKIYDNEGLKMNLPQTKLDEGRLDYIPVVEKIHRTVDLKEVLDFIKNDNEATKVRLNSGETVDFLPATDLTFSVDVDSIKGQIPVSFAGKNYAFKNELAFWDIVSSNAELRPICFVSKAEANKHGLLNYVRMEGLVSRLVPQRNGAKNSIGNLPCDVDKLYTQMMEEFKWGNINDPNVYVDYNTIYNAGVFQLRNNFNVLAQNLIARGDMDKTKAVFQKSNMLFSPDNFPYDIYSLKEIELQFNAGMATEAKGKLKMFWDSVKTNLEYYASFDGIKRQKLKGNINMEMYYYDRLARLCEQYKLEGDFASIRQDFNSTFQIFQKELN